MKKFMMVIFVLILLLGCSEDAGSTSENGAVGKKASPAEEKAKNWYVYLVAEAPQRGLISYSAQLGQVDEPDASQKYSLHYLEPIAPYVDIRFINASEESADNYKSLIKSYNEGVATSWRFEVLSDDPNAEIILSWRGIYVLNPYTSSDGNSAFKTYVSRKNPILKYMRIVDESDESTIPIIIDYKIQSISFNMNGSNSHQLRWELLNEEVVNSSPSGSMSLSSRRKDVQRKEHNVQENAVDMFTPPLLKYY